MKLTAEANELSSVSLVGGKGAHLQKLVSWNAPVAPFFVLTTECFQIFQNTGSIPSSVKERFIDFLNKYPKIALRSSMISEDHVDSSFAGLFETILGVTKSNWESSLQKIYASTKSERVMEYIHKKGLNVELLMAVVVQEEIQVEKSGVLFTRSPVTPTAAVAIDAAYGMGEGVVSGHVTVDHYQYTRTFEEISAIHQHDKPVLSQEEIRDLMEISLRMESRLGVPSDIEWGIKNEKLYLFQIRPITRSFDPITYFVDTNLSESYPGTVSPFTASFVKKAYENVFRESAVILGGKGKKLETLNYHYARLISSVDNHLYYNLEHYYAVLRALPGGDKNIENWHRMIGGKIAGVIIPHHSTEPTRFETLLMIGSFFKLIARRKTIYQNLLRTLEESKETTEHDFSKMKSSRETIEKLNAMAQESHGFGLTVINDIFVMMGLGILTKTLKKKGIREEDVVDLLKTSEGVDSVKPLEYFNRLVSELPLGFIEAFRKEDLKIGLHPYNNIFSRLKNEWNEEVIKLQTFLDKYGDRSFEELKLESLPMKNNPELVGHLLFWGKNNPSKLNRAMHSKLNVNLNWFERKVLKFTQDCISMREATRLWRGKYYQLFRLLILKLGEQLSLEDQSWQRFSVLDFFSVDHHEWKQFADGKRSKHSIQELMEQRRPWQNKKQSYPEIIPWVENEPLPQVQTSVSNQGLVGLGVSPGITEGIALVLENPTEALEGQLQNFILVTKNTDPAWVYIMSRSHGLISEKGSLLSHTAIIGRELNIPTIVGVKMATQIIKSGDKLRINATTGTIDIL